MGSALAVLETTATGADIATVGFVAGGITAPVAVATKLVGYDAGSVTRMLYDGDALIGAYDTSGTLLDRYVHGASAGDDPLIWYSGTSMADSNARYLHADRLGSIVAITSNTGALIGRNTYDEHGIPGGSNLGRFQYTGQVWLDGLGMYYYKARMYSPTLGRFLQTDPIGT